VYKSFLFNEIPASPSCFARLSFVFNEILGLFVHLLKLLLEREGENNDALSVLTKRSAFFLGVSSVMPGPPALLS
jgi:hypothetical protein